jgi:hypothetical protein
VLSDGALIIKSVLPTRESTAAPQARPLAALTREALGVVWAARLRAAREAGQLRTVRGAAAWLAQPEIREVLEEFRQRNLSFVEEQARWGVGPLFDAVRYEM